MSADEREEERALTFFEETLKNDAEAMRADARETEREKRQET